VFADPSEWESDPFLLTGRDGYLYGRGVSDNKGPLLASILATKALLDAGELDIDVCFIVEGEEESGLGLDQRGLEAVVQVCGAATYADVCGRMRTYADGLYRAATYADGC
jgi:hypothetical protein